MILRSVTVLGPKLIFITGLVIFVTAVARIVCPDLLKQCLSRLAKINFGPSIPEFRSSALSMRRSAASNREARELSVVFTFSSHSERDFV